jgi:tetratricopeptide (TPR) repeat protein/tRNA A-37 threonylcarbamoyl transferase component Bud32
VTTPVSADSLIGTTVSQYEILAKLGGGGMGVVYKARDTKLGRLVALKFLPPQWSHDESSKQRFVREAQAASATNHRNICVIHNIEEMRDGRLFIVMAYYEGETLKQKLERGPLPIIETVEIASEIADGLAKAHAQGVVHRDVKPGNLIVSEDGVKILDFGLAKFADSLQLTVPGSTIGTVAYMSPEQARGEEADARSDVWALGIVMYEMLTGAPPFRGTYQEATFHAIKNEPLPSLCVARPDLPEALERIVMKALEKDPGKRYQSAREPARELKLLLGRTVPLDLLTIEVPRPAGVDARSLPKQPPPRRIVTPLRVGIVAGLLVAIAAGWYYWSTRPIERIPVAIVPVANHTGNTELDSYRLALTSALIDELADSPNVRVVPFLRLMEMVRPFTRSGDISGNEALRAVAKASGAPYLVVPALTYRDRDAAWTIQIQVRNAQTGTTAATYETAPVTSSLVQQTAFRLAVSAADSVQQHFKANGPGRSYGQRSAGSRFREADAAKAFAEGLVKYDELEFAAALIAFTESAKIDDQHAVTHAWLSRVYLILSRRNEAVAAALRAKALVSSDVSEADAAFVDAVLSESRDDFDSAERVYRQWIARKPDETWLRTELADFLKRRDANQRAIDAYHELIQRDPTYIRPHVELCQLYTRLNDHPLAEREASLAVDRYKSDGLPGGQAQALLCLGEVQRIQGGVHLAEARRNVDAARSLIATLDQPYNLSRAIFYQGNIESYDGQLAKAGQLFEEASRQSNRVGNRQTEGLALMNLGVVNYQLGHPTPSINLFQRSRDVFLSVGLERRVAEVDVDRTAVQVDFQSRSDDVVRRLANAKANLEKRGYVNFQLVVMQSEADSNRYAGKIAAARTELQQALAIAREKQLSHQVSVLTLSLAQTELQESNYLAARALLEGLVNQGDDPEARIALGTVLVRVGDFLKAKDYLEGALATIQAGQLSGLLPLAHSALGELAYESGRDSEARQHFAAAVTSWNDPLPNAASVASRCYLALQGASIKGVPADFKTALEQASQTGRLALEAMCRAQSAQKHVQQKRFGDAIADLKDVADDTVEHTIGPELRAIVEYWRGVAMSGGGEVAGKALSDSAREQLAKLQSTLTEDLRNSFGSRRTVATILQLQPVRTHP